MKLGRLFGGAYCIFMGLALVVASFLITVSHIETLSMFEELWIFCIGSCSAASIIFGILILQDKVLN